ncbi:MAG TPA: hypothetical protein VKE74_31370 [Gemmataceae bacterium]|nr:hypothetical protein [Gemmataceae bacterium]
MPTARILAPLEGDTVQADNVVVYAAYAEFGSATDLKCQIATKTDLAENVTGDGLHTGSAISMVPLGPQSVVTGTAATPVMDQQNGVNVVSGPTPVPIDIAGIDIFRVKDEARKKLKKVTGKKLPDGSTAVYVVCQVIEVNAKTGTRKAVAAGATSVDADKKWKVEFADLPLSTDEFIQYTIRAFAYNKDLLLLGSESVAKTKK